MRRRDAAGGVEEILFDFRQDFDTHVMLIRQLFISEPNSEFGYRHPGGNRYTELRYRPTRKELADAVSRIFRYPQRLHKAPPDELRLLIETPERPRFFCAFGLLKAGKLK